MEHIIKDLFKSTPLISKFWGSDLHYTNYHTIADCALGKV